MSAEDEGKPVIDANGERIGTVSDVDDGRALVEPVPGVDPTVSRALGRIEEPGVLPLREQSVEHISESRIRLRSNL